MTAKIIQEQAEELKDQWRKLVNAYYTTPLQWDGDEGAKPRKELKRWGKEYVRKIKALAARAEQVPVDPMPFLKEISLEVLAYTFKDQPVYRKDGTLDEDKSEGKVRWDFHHGEGFGTMGIAIAQLLMGTNDGVAKSARARDEAFAALRDAVEAIPTDAAPKPKPAKARPKPAEARPSIPTIAEKFAKVPGSLEEWMGLLRAKGLVDAKGSFAMAADAKGKGKLIAAWTAAQELFQLDGYATDKELAEALRDHIHGLTGLDRLDKVRKNKGFSGLVTAYKEDLQVD